MAAIRVNNELITHEDLAIDCIMDHESLIEYWAMHEIEDLCESEEIEDRLMKLILDFAKTPEAKTLSFVATLDGEHRKVKIEKA